MATGVTAIGGFILKGPTGWLNNLSPDLEGRKESGKAIEGVIEGHFQRRRLWPRTKVILELISPKNTLLNGLADLLGMEKLEL